VTTHWPPLAFDSWAQTYATLHRWTQIVGKIRLEKMPAINHSWHVTLYVTPRGLTTLSIPSGNESFQIDFDFLDHRLWVRTSRGQASSLELRPRSVADFYVALLTTLRQMGIPITIDPHPCEVEDATPFDEDERHASYDEDAAQRCWRVLAQSDRVFTDFRAGFVGKCSPVHFFWGAFDLAVTRFSGRPAPLHPGGVPHLSNRVVRDAYSHEVCSAGFWPGGTAVPYPVFYAYAYPEPPGFREARISPSAAAYKTGLGEFLLPYEAVRQAASPDKVLLEFLQSTYDAAADLGRWDRAALER
jgi:hypothetical protein